MDHYKEAPICIDVHGDPERIHTILESVPSEESALEAAELFSQLSSPARIRLLSMLAADDLCVGELSEALGMSQPSVSHHLRLLRQSGVVKYRKYGKHVIYYISDTTAGNLARHILKDILIATEENADDEEE